MRSNKIRTIAVLASAALVVGAFVSGPAEAKKKKKPKPPAAPVCAPFAVVEPTSPSGQTAEAPEVPVVQVTNAHTEAAPLVVEYAHGPALWETATQMPIEEDTQFFNFQVAPDAAKTALYISMEWASPSPSDIDMYIYDESGTEIDNSGAFNAAPVPGVFDADGDGGMGFESVKGLPLSTCSGITIESRAFMTAGEDVTLSLWLGDPAA